MSSKPVRERVEFETARRAHALYCGRPANLRLMEETFGVKVVSRDNFFKISGEEKGVGKALRLLENLNIAAEGGRAIGQAEFRCAVESVASGGEKELFGVLSDKVEVMSRKRFVVPKTAGQKAYIDAIRKHDIVFAVGPAGTGKTYLAMAMAVNALKRKEASRIILTRPAVEAGESLGFLPGDLYEKVMPYMRPLYDALYDMIPIEEIQTAMERGVIEVAPLAYMRGRTLNDSFIVLDEAQNSTPEQMKMFLTRMGFDSKAVITGDITQVDLPDSKSSGLIQVQRVLKGIEGIRFVYFDERDTVRHPLVQKIILAYDDTGREK